MRWDSQSGIVLRDSLSLGAVHLSFAPRGADSFVSRGVPWALTLPFNSTLAPFIVLPLAPPRVTT